MIYMYIDPKFLSAPSAFMTDLGVRGRRLKILLKMLKFSFKFLRSHYFLTIS